MPKLVLSVMLATNLEPLTALQTTNEVVLRRKTITEEVAREILAENVKEVEKTKTLNGLITRNSQKRSC